LVEENRFSTSFCVSCKDPAGFGLFLPAKFVVAVVVVVPAVAVDIVRRPQHELCIDRWTCMDVVFYHRNLQKLLHR
jgi:hypothetical protein